MELHDKFWLARKPATILSKLLLHVINRGFFAMAQMKKATTTIDGSHGEGGGQILRNACTYAAILRTDVRITNIRAGRKTPGLRPQHLVGLRLLEAASGGCLAEGNHVGSTEILFVGSNKAAAIDRKNDSHAEKKREYVGDTQTAGSVCLLMQTILPYALFRSIAPQQKERGNCNDDDDNGPLRFILKGGTDAAFAPPLDYCRYVFLPMLQNYGCLVEREMDVKNGVEEWKNAIDLSLVKRGFYPRGGGEVRLAIRRLSSKALPLPPIRLTERGNIVGITIRAFVAGNCPMSMAQTLSATVQKIIQSNPRYRKVPITIDLSEDSKTTIYSSDRGSKRPRNSGSGCGVSITAKTDTGCVLGGSSIGSPKIPLEETARIATKEIIEAMEGGGCVDDRLQDQLIIFMALAGGVSEIVTNSLTLHTQTAIWLASKMLPSARFEITKLGAAEDEPRCGMQPAPIGANRNDGGTDKDIPGCHRIRCHGIGFRPP